MLTSTTLGLSVVVLRTEGLKSREVRQAVGPQVHSQAIQVSWHGVLRYQIHFEVLLFDVRGLCGCHVFPSCRVSRRRYDMYEYLDGSEEAATEYLFLHSSVRAPVTLIIE